MCVSPLKGWHVDYTENGKKKLLITQWNVDHVERLLNGSWVSVAEYGNTSDGLVSRASYDNVSSMATKVIREYITIPCGRCIECLKDRGQQWTNRCMLEYLYSQQSSYFVWWSVFFSQRVFSNFSIFSANSLRAFMAGASFFSAVNNNVLAWRDIPITEKVAIIARTSAPFTGPSAETVIALKGTLTSRTADSSAILTHAMLTIEMILRMVDI